MMGRRPAQGEGAVLAAEHRIYPLALKLVASGRARVVGERVRMEGGGAADPVRPSRTG